MIRAELRYLIRDNICMDTVIKKVCGDSAISFDIESISNDPNFVFQPDETFSTVILYNSEGGVINVNSWLECANYVNGGWFTSVSDLINYEKNLFFGLLFVSGVFGFFEILVNYRRNKYSI
jgi:hypothetical protein